MAQAGVRGSSRSAEGMKMLRPGQDFRAASMKEFQRQGLPFSRKTTVGGGRTGISLASGVLVASVALRRGSGIVANAEATALQPTSDAERWRASSWRP